MYVSTSSQAATRKKTEHSPSQSRRCSSEVSLASCLPSGGQLFFQHFPDAQLDLIEFGRKPHLIVSWTWQMDFENVFGAPWPRGHYNNAVGEIGRLFDAMQSQKAPSSGSAPRFAATPLASGPGLGVQRAAKGSSINKNLRLGS